MKRPRVSIVTASFNQVRFIERTIRSVLCQDYDNLEYLVLDSCSPDGTGAILQKYAPAIDVLVVEKDKGQSDALNRGFRRATGDILGYLNADDCLASAGTISQVVERFAENSTADVIYGQRDWIHEDGHFFQNVPHRPFCERMLYRVDYIPQEATFWRRGIYETAGGMIDTTFDFAMDYELWLRFLSKGAHMISVPDRWGLFRWYPNQKSQEAWKTTGLAEIARLQDRYLGHRVSEQDMSHYNADHLYTAHPTTHPGSHQFYAAVWGSVLQLQRTQLGRQPLDGWVYHTSLNLARLERLRRQRARLAA